MYLLLNACSTPVTKGVYSQPTPFTGKNAVAEEPLAKPLISNWPERKLALNQLNHFAWQGKIAVHTKSDSGSGSVDWQQSGNHYTISLLGPVGSFSFKLKGSPGHVSLAKSDGTHYLANTPEGLLATHWRMRLPVSNLKYWVRGIPAPGSSEQHFDTQARLTSLMQQGFTITFVDYQRVGRFDLPKKIVITGPTLIAKIIISHWNL